MPKSLIVTGPVVGGRALRASRSCHESHKWARCARERITFAVQALAVTGGERLTSRRWCRTSRMQARRCSLRREECQSRGAEPTCSGCGRILTWRGFAVAPPFHWHCSRSGQGRQRRMRAAYTTRRLPSASLRRSWTTSFCPAGQPRVLRLERKVLTREAVRFPGQAHLRGEHSPREEPCAVR